VKRFSIAIVVFLYFLVPSTTRAERVSLLVIDAESCLVNEAVKGLKLPEGIQVRFFTYTDMMQDQSAGDFIATSEVIVVDAMMSELGEWVIENTDIRKKRVYALRSSRDDEGLKREGFVFDPHIQEYFSHPSVPNIQNLIYRVIHQELDPSIAYEEVAKLPDLGIYHSDAETIFTSYGEYLNWYKGRRRYTEGAPWIGMMLFKSSIVEGQVGALDYLIERFEEEGFNVLPCFGLGLDVLTSLLMDKDRHARVDLVLAFSLKFYSAINDQIQGALAELNVPIINAINLHSIPIDEWRDDPVGIPPMDVVWCIANPEISGLIEPTPLTGKVELFDKQSAKALFIHSPIKETIELLIPRMKMWIRLKEKKNEEKRVAILYYNHAQGKQNIGATGLNVFRSLERILRRMQEEGYQLEVDERITENSIKDMILKYGRNIGSWARGELDRMLKEEKLVRLPVSTYRKWFDTLPERFKENVLRQWGTAEDSTIMIKDGQFIIPAVILGNVLVMPEPARGWGDDAMKLYHDPTLYPHHQYIAAYLWLKYVFRADAMIHLGTHATYEWLPGKQAGLSPSCPPDVLITDIPNIYPYIVDDVGEGIQAKRRGRGVIVDYLTPPVKEAGLYHEYSRLYDMINSYNRSIAMGSQTAAGKLEKIKEVISKTGLAGDLNVTDLDEDALERLEHYLLEIRENFMPYGLHTFGQSPDGEALHDTIKAIVKSNRRAEEGKIKEWLIDSGPREIDHLIKGLAGGYIPSGEGNDPVRNLSAIPTGKNFYGFNPQKIPSRTAWELGRRAAEQIIEKSLREKGRYPDKVAVVLWATETIRNEGINESTILYLMGLRPLWDKTDRVTGIEVIPGKELNRPRIDVLVNPSGLYRDLFPNFILFLDKAIQKAALQTDIENLISKHNTEIVDRLVKGGMAEEEAALLSKIRIFTEKPGSYGTGVSEMTENSGVWESDDEVARVYENKVGYAFGLGKWGEEAKEVFKENLKRTDVAIHSISSNIFGTMDNDDMFGELGGLSLAIKKESGESPDTLIAMQRIPGQVGVEDAAKTIGREMRSRYLNPKWVEGMKKEDYAGAREMSSFVEYMWGWQVTVPSTIDKAKWDQTYEVYVEDKYGLELKEFFKGVNPWAHQSITARMLEAIRKDYFKADDEVRNKLAVEYARSVVEDGPDCCEHTCNNPLLNQMVVKIISLPGVMPPEMVEKFQQAIEQALRKALAEQVKERLDLQKKLNKAWETIEGYKMEEMRPKTETEAGRSPAAIEWLASLFVILIIGLAIYGAKRNAG